MADKTFIITAISLLLSIFFNIGVISYVAYKKLSKLEAYFPHSTLIAMNPNIWGETLFGRICRLGNIVASFCFTDYLARKGQIDAAEPRSVPRRLRMWVMIPYAICFFQVLMAGILWVVMKLVFKR